MSDNPFLLKTPKDMLTKAGRDLVNLKAQMSPDTIFNFFVTAYHVMDYVKRLGTVSQTAIDGMYADPDFELCNFICNRGKHLVVTRNPKTTTITALGGSGFNESPLNTFTLNEGPQWRFYCDNKEIDPIRLAEAVIRKWELFFRANGVS